MEEKIKRLEEEISKKENELYYLRKDMKKQNNLIVVTGGIASGKSTVILDIRKYLPNAVYISADKIGHETLNQPLVFPSLIHTFQELDVFNYDGLSHDKAIKIVEAQERPEQSLIDSNCSFIIDTSEDIVEKKVEQLLFSRGLLR